MSETESPQASPEPEPPENRDNASLAEASPIGSDSYSTSTRIDEHFEPLAGPASLLSIAESLLREPGRVVYELGRGRGALVTGATLAIVILSLMAYGITVGVFSGGEQLWAAPMKITLGAILSIAICFPSLAIFASLGGVRLKPTELLGNLIATVALYSILLVGFGPVSWVFSQATDSVVFMGGIHLAFWSIGLHYALRFLHQVFVFRNGHAPRHFTVWLVVFVVVSLQMTTYLRPIVGESESFFTSEKKFFVVHWLDLLTGVGH